jgi:hypothetical protein
MKATNEKAHRRSTGQRKAEKNKEWNETTKDVEETNLMDSNEYYKLHFCTDGILNIKLWKKGKCEESE